MAPRPSSPTSLLWAHQIKRENAHLLDRMKALETAIEDLKSHVTTIGAFNKEAHETAEACSAIDTRIRLLEDDDKDQQMRFEALDKDRNDRIEKQESTLKVMEKKVRALEIHCLDLKEERIEALQGYSEATLGRIEKLEAELNKLTTNQNGDKAKTAIDVSLVRAVNGRVEQLEQKRKEHHNGITALHERVRKLEEADMDAEHQRVQASDTNLKQKLPFLPQSLGVGLSSPSVGRIQVPSSPLAKRRIEHTNNPSTKREVGVSKRSAAKESTQGPNAHAKRSLAETVRNPAPMRASQRYRT
jgi:chromosome segregation ATPase